MIQRFYLMEQGFLSRLLTDRKDLLEIARSIKSAEEMRRARADLMANISQINIAPKNDDEVSKSYKLDGNGTAMIPIVGELTPHAETDICGAYTANALTEYSFIVAATQAADKNPDVKRIEYYIDSPGGYVDGIDEAAAAIAETEKPTTATVHNMAASAGYWLASQTDEIIAVGPSTVIGSIGVAIETYDITELEKQQGLKRLVFTSTDAPDKRLDLTKNEDQKKLVERLNDLHKVFASKVASGRGTTVKDVNENYGRGGVVIAAEAKKRGMIDGVVDYNKVRKPVVDREEKPASEKAENKEVPMDKVQLKTEHSAVYDEVYRDGVEAGVKQERARRNAIRNIAKSDPENSRLAEVCEEAIEAGTPDTDAAFMTKVNVAIRDGGKLDGENAPDVKTGEDMTGLSPDDIEAARLAGMSIEEYRKYMEEAE